MRVGEWSGVADATGCDVDVPPDECLRSGGVVHIPVKLEDDTEVQAVLFIVSRTEEIALGEAGFTDSQIEAYTSATMSGLNACVQITRDRTKLAACVIAKSSDNGFKPLRGLVLAPKEHFGLYGAKGGLMIPSLKATLRFSNGKVVLLAILALPPRLSAL